MAVRKFTPPFICTLIAGALQAQVAVAQGGFLEEVIVTAEKRETTLQDTAIAVSAFTQDELERGLINNNMDIQMAVPNMLMSKGFPCAGCGFLHCQKVACANPETSHSSGFD